MRLSGEIMVADAHFFDEIVELVKARFGDADSSGLDEYILEPASSKSDSRFSSVLKGGS